MVHVHDRGVRCDVLHAAAGPLQVPGVEEEHQLRLDAAGRDVFDVVEARQKRVHLRKRRRDQHPHMLAGSLQCLRECEAAAERVPVRILVAEDQDLLVGLDQLPDLVVERSRLRPCGGYRSTSSAS